MISEDRQSHIAHLIRDELKKKKAVSCPNDKQTLSAIKEGVSAFVRTHNLVDKAARLQLSSQKRSILEGTSEWEILYNRFYEQEMKKKGLL